MNKFSKIILDCYKGQIPTQFSEMNKEAREEAIRTELLNAIGLERFEKKALRKALRRPEVQVQMFEIIEELVNENFKTNSDLMNSFYQTYCDIKNLSEGDENLFYVEGKHSLIVSEYSGSHMTARRQRFQSGQSFKLEMRNFIIATYVYLEQLLAGRQTLEKFVLALNEAVAKKNEEMIAEAFQAGLSATPAAYQVTGSFNEDNILTMLEKLEAVNGAKPRLIGTATAIRKLQGVVDVKYSDDMKDVRNSNFTLPVWNGYSCDVIPNAIKNGTIDQLVLDSTKVYAICSNEKICKVVYEGDSMVKENSSEEFQNADLTLDYVCAYKANACVAFNQLIGLVDLA